MINTVLKHIRLWLSVLLLVPLSLYAAVPQTINYQGYLTDPSGAPVNATVDITFRIYDVDTGGTDIWSETDAVVISDGKFTTPLGDGTAFPTALFDNASLYLGIEIEADGEMNPRKPLLTAPYAFKAQDADTLEGMSASTFISTSGTQTITGEIAITQKITTQDVELTAGGEIEFNDGSLQGTNAVNSILAADGSGSTLDADLVDGMQASEIIDAASDEVRTPISDADLPFNISQSGSYYLTENLTHSGTTTDAISVNADHVTIDMMGFTLSGPGNTPGSNDGIDISSQTNVTIMNGTVRDFGNRGVTESFGASRAHRIIDVRAVNNGGDGIFLFGANNQVRGCTAQSNGGSYGIYAGTGSLLINNTAAENANAGIIGTIGASLSNNTAYNNQGTWGIYGGNGATLINNTVYNNAQWGVYGSGSNLIENNTVYVNNTSNTANTGGIRVGVNSRVTGNAVSDNDDYGIFITSDHSIVENNHVAGSTNGIYFQAAASGSAYRDNTVSNSTNDFTGGINLGGNDSF